MWQLDERLVCSASTNQFDFRLGCFATAKSHFTIASVFNGQINSFVFLVGAKTT
ncbi:hypothetical protein RchiOBHm_Chr3g0486351 [Rosa chinensis]|uniref:Uncharacterized protein n=1 Tax=Rosa chinensis TaxID=74649 RepID=A0A2P6RF82_ROSCH|nr:hypothetical protein RchiOBHm_Chr3g0486351 [Rosa chinensis]